MISNINNEIYLRRVGLTLPSITNSCNTLRDLVVEKLTPGFDTYPGRKFETSYGTESMESGPEFFGNYVFKYNLFMYPYDQFHDLYNEIKKTFIEVNPNYYNEKYYISGWVNFNKPGDFVDWHQHRQGIEDTWHTVYYANADSSKITYEFLNDGSIHDIDCEDNLLIVAKNSNTRHRTWPWEGEGERISIATNIMPWHQIEPGWVNYWVPL